MTDRTIFCLGARGHDEDATSDLLRFFLDPRERHGLGALFLDALLQGAAGTVGFRPDGVVRVAREMRTADRQRIDLYIESDTSILVVQNTHWSSIGNPFASYERCARAEGERLGKRVDFLVLGLRDADRGEVKPPWSFLDWNDFREAIERRATNALLAACGARWSVLTREFLDHLRIDCSAHDEQQVEGMLRTLRNADGLLDERRFEDIRRRLVPHVAARLASVVGEGGIRPDLWHETDRDHGWRRDRALDFQVLDRKACDVFVSFAVRYSHGAPIETDQLCLVAWVRPNQRRPGVAEHCRARLRDLRFEAICPPATRCWDSGTAHERPLGDMPLAAAIDALQVAVRALRDVTAGWANAADPLPFRDPA